MIATIKHSGKGTASLMVVSSIIKNNWKLMKFMSLKRDHISIILELRMI